MELLLPIAFGALVGLSLGLTGGGGSIFAVPLLTFGLGLEPKAAVAMSLLAVGVMALMGFVSNWRSGQVEISTGLLFSVAGMMGAPFGAWAATFLADRVLLALFALLMLVIAVRMWRSGGAEVQPALQACDPSPDAAVCQRNAAGQLHLTTACAGLLLLLGTAAGVLSGMFGVGGGFIIVPALVLFSGMEIRRAIGTSLLVIAMISLAGTASLWAMGREVPLSLAAPFVGGGVAGVLAGSAVSRRLDRATLLRVFAAAIIAVACFVLFRTSTT